MLICKPPSRPIFTCGPKSGASERSSNSAFRIPDVTVIVGDPDGKILRKPPFICIEILSPEDRLKCVQTGEAFHEFKGALLRTENPALEIPLSEIFE